MPEADAGAVVPEYPADLGHHRAAVRPQTCSTSPHPDRFWSGALDEPRPAPRLSRRFDPVRDLSRREKGSCPSAARRPNRVPRRKDSL